jgi:cytochrome c oxidase subunit 1
MPRRIYTYDPGMPWAGLNALSSSGVILMSLAVVIFIANFFWHFKRGALAGNNPWGASTLEWATTSPPPSYNFADPPTVNGRDALWDELPDQPVVGGLDEDCRQFLCTKIMDADPDHRDEFPGPTPVPFWAAIATTIFFVSTIFTAKLFFPTLALVGIALLFWYWPKRQAAERRRSREIWEH